MNRRRLLERLGASGTLLFGGCTGAPRGDATTRSPVPDGLQRRVSLVEQTSLPERYQLRIQAEVRDPRVTDSGTARVRVTVTNEGPARGLSVSTDRCALFNRYSQSSTPRGVWLAAADDPRYTTRGGPRWVADPPENGAYPDYGCALRTYEPGESVHAEYALYHDGRTDGYLQPGTYRFARDDVLLTPGPSAEADADGSRTFGWAVSIHVADPR